LHLSTAVWYSTARGGSSCVSDRRSGSSSPGSS
jgi:hypothetical protein